MGNRLTFDIRCESDDVVAEVLGWFSEAAFLAGNSFSFDPGIIRRRLRIRAGRAHPGRVSLPHTLLFPMRSVHFPRLSVNRGIRPLTGLPEWDVASAFQRCAGALTTSCGPFRPVAMGVPLIPLSPWIRVHTDDGGTVADPCD